MQTVGQMIDNVASITVTNANEDERQRILEIIQSVYYEVCAMTSWTVLRETVDLAFSGSVTGIWLPADLLGIDAVVGSQTGGYRHYLPRDEANVDYSETTYRFYFSDIALEPVAQGDDLQISSGATTFTAPGLTTDYTDDYIMFDDEPGLYKLTAQTTIERTYYGKPLSGAHYQVRPVGTKKISAVDSAREATTDTLTCYYWRLPPPLYRETDRIIIPADRAIELMSAIRYVGERHGQTFKANAFKAELYGPNGNDGVLNQSINDNPDFNPPAPPQDIQGNILNMGANTFSRRSGITNSHLPGGSAWRGYFNK